MDFFVRPNTIVRTIWGKSDTILFIFAGASAEFAINKAVDWLYFTGRLPADPLGRLFSTVAYARQIVFSSKAGAYQAIDRMRSIHAGVEKSRGELIPDWAYRDVLFMLIDYSIRSFEVLERKLSTAEKTEVFEVFQEVGARMGIRGLPETYADWVVMRAGHLNENLAYSAYTTDLYRQYRKHLGSVRYTLLRQAQILVVPEGVNQLLRLGKFPWLSPVLGAYKISRTVGLDNLMKALILPPAYQEQIRQLDIRPA